MVLAIEGKLRRNRDGIVVRPATPVLDDAAPSTDSLIDPLSVPPVSRQLERSVWITYGVLGVALLAYLVTLLVRGPNASWTWLDGWSVVAVEAVASAACIVRGFNRHPGRAAPLALGFALLAWTLGDAFLTIESLGGNTPSTPSIADAFYLGFYPLAYVATVLLIRNGLGRLSKPNWLDGIVAGLGAAAVCAAFAFHDIMRAAGGSNLAVATNLAYPIGDLLLLSLVIGGTVLLSGRRTFSWLLLATGIGLNVVGDTFNLFSSGDFASRVGSDFNAIAWPTAILLMSMSVWLRPRNPDPLQTPKVAGFVFPSIAAAGGLAILVVGTLHPVTRVALGLATATLLMVGLRLSFSARDLRLVTEERHRQAQTDELTGLGNRRHLFTVLDAFFTDLADPWTPVRPMAFLFIDLNHFKEINDSFGHPAGDDLLKQLGPRLKRALPPAGSVFRLGGDELAVIIIDADAVVAAQVAGRILAELKEPFVLRKVSASVGASIGIALAPSDATESTGLLWCADTAMYRAKLGQAPFAFYDHGLDGDENLLNLVDELREAVENGGFVLHYQPQLDYRYGEVLAVEALIRWPHPRLGMVPPLKFIPLAEDAGLMRALTTWVLEEALAQVAKWRSDGINLAVSVNVTPSNLLQDGFIDQIGSLLHQNGLPGSSLIVEITEGSIITDFARAKAVIERLRDIDVVVSIDDFGAGFTSLAYLSSLAVGELKLDRTFITGLSGDGKERDLELVRATIQLGHDMRLRVVAEGIEDIETLDLLSELGCDRAQGYFISRPMPANKLSFRSGLASPEGAPV